MGGYEVDNDSPITTCHMVDAKASRLSLSIAHLSATIENPRHLLISLCRSVAWCHQFSSLYNSQVGVCV
ncbi:hypothetical protein L2E82_18610 [Cichorium intybus]|uniref:Uncharacterized protein n=1 Tax=Cichorium intybus TaxID=13427 RepID=A0ACB9FAS9_CICIN|nr:hypothetical protein L2E82_18610 [Cichorium intybus]